MRHTHKCISCREAEITPLDDRPLSLDKLMEATMCPRCYAEWQRAQQAAQVKYRQRR